MIASCRDCSWELDVPTQEAADKKLATHRQLRHGDAPLQGVTQLDPVRWREDALDAVRSLAALGRDFAMYEIHDYGVGDPADPKSQMGRLAKDAHRLGIAHPVDHDLSKRPATRRSSVRLWSADASRCETHGKRREAS